MQQRSGQVAREDSAASLQFEDIFSLRKPRDAKAGLASGLKSMAKGVVAGSLGLVAAPIIGAHQEGLRGFAKGAMAGVAGAVVLPVTGFIVGGAQMVRGVVNTPEAVRQSMLGRHWDEDTRTWIDMPTLALALEDGVGADARHAWHRHRPQRLDGPGGSGSGAGRPGQAGREDFYELLGVPRDAGPELIKRQYYILARRLHPDKDPDNPQAKERFQQLGEAYQVLCNPELRRRYDTHGAEGLEVNFMDSGEFFTALFGSQRFDHLVGELVIAAAARSGGELTPAQLRRLQLAREERLCIMLAALLRRWVEEDYQGFMDSMTAEAAELATASFGEVMLHTVGRVYEAQAEIYLGGLINGSLAALRARGQSLRSQVNAASLALRVYKTQQQLEKLDRQQEQQQELLQQQQQQEPPAPQPPQQQHSRAGTEVPGGLRHDAPGNSSPSGSAASLSRQDSGQTGEPHATAFATTSTGETGGSALNGQPGQAEQPPPQGAAAGSAAASAAAAAGAAAAAARARLEEQALPVMLDAMWAANVLDIEATLRHVCRRVLNDPQVSKQVRRQRASGLLQLGRIFRAARAPIAGAGAGFGGSSPRAAPRPQRQQKTAKQHMEDAMMHVMEKRMQADAQQGG